MSGYQKPKIGLHKEFVYLNDDTIINSLSALEAGKIDEILQKSFDTRERGFEAGVGIKGVGVKGGKKSEANVEEEWTKRRTRFSAFDAWLEFLNKADAIGHLTHWDLETRNDLGIGDTILFTADVEISPIQHNFLTYIAFAKEAAKSNSPFKQSGTELVATKNVAKMMSDWMGTKSEEISLLVYLAPNGVTDPRIVARLEDPYLVRGTQAVQGRYTIIGQVEELISANKSVPALRVFKDTPPTIAEIKVIQEGMEGFKESAEALGITISDQDINIAHPGVVIHPIA
ncbi:MAG: hypothetical protein WA090_08210, partial [Candidatus Nanopelagicaceae bacterium]